MQIYTKDIFERDYQMYLASRLLQNLSKSDQLERLLVAKLKDRNNIKFISKLEDMFEDIEQSKEYMVDFNKTYNDIDFEYELNVTVCGVLAWPQCSIQAVKVPADIANVSQKFVEFYVDKFENNRDVKLRMDKGTAEICVQFNVKCEKILVVSTYQMMVLLLFNNKKIWTFEEILDETRIPREDLSAAVLSMAHPKVKVLRKAPNIKEIADSHKFQINSKYTNPGAKIPITTFNFKPNPLPTGYPTKLYALRRHQMDAAIVRIMKAFKTLKHTDLISKVVKQLICRFKPNLPTAKKRIANLIDLEYLHRDENDRQFYHYKP